MEEELQQEQQPDMGKEVPQEPTGDTQEAVSTEGSATPQGQVEEAVTGVSQPPKPLPKSEGVPLNFDSGFGVELSFAEPNTVFRLERDEEAEQDETLTALAIVGEDGYTAPRTQSEKELLLKAANDKIKQREMEDAKRNVEQNIANAQSPEETLENLEMLAKAQNSWVPFNKLRAEEIKQKYQYENDTAYIRADEQIAGLMRLAQTAQRAQDDLWDTTGWWDIAVDAVELIAPGSSATSVASERIEKAERAGSAGIFNYLDMGGSQEDLAEKLHNLPDEKRTTVVNKMIDEIVEQETILFRNGNSLLQADQLDLLRQTLENGFAAYLGDSPTGDVISGEIGESIFSAIDMIPVVGPAISGVRTASKSLMSGLVRKLMPSEDARNYAGARSQSGHSVDNNVAADPVGNRAAMNGTGSVIRAAKDTGLSDFATASRFAPVQATDADSIRKAVEYNGKMVPVEEMQRLLKELETNTDVKSVTRADAEVDAVRNVPDLDIVRAEIDAIKGKLSSGIKYVPTKDVTIPRIGRTVEDNSEVTTAAQAIEKFKRSVDEGTPAVDEIEASLEWSAPDPNSIADSIRDIGQSQLIDKGAYELRTQEVARTVETLTGSSLKHNPADTVWRANDQTDSLGDFRIYFGDGDKGFETKEMAVAVGKSAIGEDLRPVQKNGKWFLEKEFTHKYNPRKEAGVLDQAKVSSANPLAAWFINPLRKLGVANLRDVMGNIEVNRAVANNILKPAKKAIKKLKDEEKVAVSTLLSKGDELQKVFTKEEALEVLKRIPSNKEYDAYLAVRNVFDAHFDIINNNARKAMEQEGWKSLRTADADDLVFGRVLTESEAKELGESALDVQTKATRSLDDLREDEVLMFSNVRKENDDGVFNIVIGKRENLGELPHDVVKRREGHVTRTYEDRKFKVVQEVERVVNGVRKTETRTLGITRLEAESEELLEAVAKERGYPVETLKVRRTVENPSEDVEGFLDDMGNIGYVSSNVRARGDMLLGAKMNEARVADPLTSMTNAQTRIERELNRDVVRTLEQKFMNTWGEYLRDPSNINRPALSFPKEGGLRLDGETPMKVQRQVKNFHDYILTMDGIQKGKFAEYLNSAMTAMEESLYRSGGVRFAKSLQKVVDGDAQRAFMKLATNAYIIGRPLFQIPTNMLQVVNVMVRYPMTGTRAAARALGVASALAGRNSEDFGAIWKALGKTGYSDKELNDLLNLIDESGIVGTTGGVDDFLSLAEEGLHATGMKSGLGRSFHKAGSLASEVVRTPLRVSSKLQEGSINYTNLVALVAEYDNHLAKGLKLNAKTKTDLLTRTRQLTQAQNSLDQFGYQQGHNPLQMMFQFVQHVNKLFLDIAVEPYVKLALDRGIVKGNEGIFAETRGVAARTAGLTMALFGVNGLPIGSDIGGNVTNSLRESYIEMTGSDVPDAIWTIFQGGLINQLVNASIDGKVDLTARVSPSAFVDMVVDMFNDMSLDVLGAFGGITESVFDIGEAVYRIGTTPELDTWDKVTGMMTETATFFSGFKDYEKAQIAKTWLSHPYAGTLSGPMRVTYEEAVFSLFSVNSKMVEDLYRNADFGGSTDKTQAEKVSRVMIRQLNRELTEVKQAGELDYFTTLDLTEKWSNAAKAHLESGQYEDVNGFFQQFMVTENGEGFRNFIRDYIEGKSYDNQRRVLRRLREETQFQDYKEQIDQMLWYMEEL